MTIKLRDYQIDVLNRLRMSCQNGNRRVCLVLPTGAGKTVIGADLARSSWEKGKRVYWLTHRKELIDQTSLAFNNAGVPHGRIEAGVETNPKQRVQICSVQTLVRRLDKMPEPSLILCDETHRARAATWEKILSKFNKAYQVGLTATPTRLSGEGLGEIFDDMVIGPSMKELMAMGNLCQYRYFARKMDMKGIGVRAGDFAKNDAVLALKQAKITGSLIEEYQEHTPGKKMLVFCPTVQFAKDLADEFAGHGIPAAEVDGQTPDMERKMSMSMFRSGDLAVLTSCDLFLEGLDVPGVEVIGMLRPTQSTTIFLQSIGRGMRPAPGKKECVIFDHVGNLYRHGYPDDDREWSLEMDDDGPKANKEASVSTCKSCFAAFPPSAKKCPVCGSVKIAKERVFRTEGGRLEEVRKQEKVAKEIEKQKKRDARRGIRTYEDALAVEFEMGYAKGWSGHYCKAKGIPITKADITI